MLLCDTRDNSATSMPLSHVKKCNPGKWSSPRGTKYMGSKTYKLMKYIKSIVKITSSIIVIIY